MWPDKVHFDAAASSLDSATFSELKMQRIDRVVMNYETSLKELASSSRSRDSISVSSARAKYAYLWAEMRCTHHNQNLDDLFYHNKLSTIHFGSIGSRNGSSLCDQRVGLEVLSGYFMRRYHHKSKYCTEFVEILRRELS